MKIESAYFCSTPYQLIAAMSMAKDENEKSDLYILSQFANVEVYAERIKKTNIFFRVRLIDDDYIKSFFINNKVLNKLHLSMALSFVFTDRIVKKFLFKDTSYKKLYFSSKAYILRLVEFYFEKRNPNTEKIYFDDGIGSYSTLNRIINLRERDYFIKKVIAPFGKRLKSNKIFLYSPEIFKSLNANSAFEVYKINNVCKDSIDTINAVFGVDDSSIINEPAILLDTIATEAFEPKNIDTYINIVDKVINTLGIDNISIKRHPRDKTKKKDKYHYYENNSIPFEVVIANSDVNDKVLISYFSTAVITPKILFDQEPYVIMLNNLVEPRIKVSKEIADCFLEIKKHYKNPDRFIIPSSEAEFLNALSLVKKQVNNE